MRTIMPLCLAIQKFKRMSTSISMPLQIYDMGNDWDNVTTQKGGGGGLRQSR
jgi:hypothetical protein